MHVTGFSSVIRFATKPLRVFSHLSIKKHLYCLYSPVLWIQLLWNGQAIDVPINFWWNVRHCEKEDSRHIYLVSEEWHNPEKPGWRSPQKTAGGSRQTMQSQCWVLGTAAVGMALFPGGQSSLLWVFKDISAQEIKSEVLRMNLSPGRQHHLPSVYCGTVALKSPSWASLLSERCLGAAQSISILLGKHSGETHGALFLLTLLLSR